MSKEQNNSMSMAELGSDSKAKEASQPFTPVSKNLLTSQFMNNFNSAMIDGDDDSFSIKTDSDYPEEDPAKMLQFFPDFDGTKDSNHYSILQLEPMPWEDKTFIYLPQKVRINLRLHAFKAKHEDLYTRLSELNGKIYEYDLKFIEQKRPKYELYFFQRKQNQLKDQLKKEIKEYQDVMQKMKEDLDKKIEKYNLQHPNWEVGSNSTVRRNSMAIRMHSLRRPAILPQVNELAASFTRKLAPLEIIKQTSSLSQGSSETLNGLSPSDSSKSSILSEKKSNKKLVKPQAKESKKTVSARNLKVYHKSNKSDKSNNSRAPFGLRLRLQPTNDEPPVPNFKLKMKKLDGHHRAKSKVSPARGKKKIKEPNSQQLYDSVARVLTANLHSNQKSTPKYESVLRRSKEVTISSSIEKIKRAKIMRRKGQSITNYINQTVLPPIRNRNIEHLFSNQIHVHGSYDRQKQITMNTPDISSMLKAPKKKKGRN